MLILGRKLKERIRLTLPDRRGIVVWVSVERLGGNDCRIGIEAPPAVEIVREEVIGHEAPSR
jgi:sRNA-binding carbon storage regulator CsrA